jgi:hypothetical protein
LQVSADELIKAIRLLNVEILPQDADAVMQCIQDSSGRVTSVQPFLRCNVFFV